MNNRQEKINGLRDVADMVEENGYGIDADFIRGVADDLNREKIYLGTLLIVDSAMLSSEVINVVFEKESEAIHWFKMEKKRIMNDIHNQIGEPSDFDNEKDYIDELNSFIREDSNQCFKADLDEIAYALDVRKSEYGKIETTGF